LCNKIVHVFDDDTYIGPAYIDGMKYVKGKFGWFPTLVLLLLTGKKIDGWKYSIYPHTLMLSYTENEYEKE
jgi:hypothetical protein